jgi:hypothetical protein
VAVSGSGHRDIEAAEVRSTWLAASLEALDRHGHLERYRQVLPAPFHDLLLDGVVAGTWLPAEVAVAHYAACEALELTALEQLELGMEVGAFAERSFIGCAATQLARGMGVNPWTVLEAMPKLWSRMWRGGELTVHKVGPKDAQLEIRGWPLASYAYTRLACRGLITSLTRPVATTVYVSEHEKLCKGGILAYRIAWV